MPRTPDPLARTSAAAPYQRFPDIGEQTPFRTVIGIIVGVLMFLLAAPVISQVIVAAGWLGVGRPGSLATYTAQAARFQHPVGMLGANLGIAALIPITLILLKGINRAPLSWIWSVTGRPRWGYFAVCVVTAAAVFTGAVLILGQPSGSPTANLALFVVIIVATSPLQAAAEEVFFRGYLAQSVGTLTGQAALAIGLPAALFALWHGTQNPPLIASRFAFGVLAGILTWLTGGLEAAVAIHIANNFSSYLPALLSGSLTATRTVTAVSWPASAFQIGIFAVATASTWLIGRRAHLRRHRASADMRCRPPVPSS